MADLLIVGNGFDLYHGLPTGYTDFLTFIQNWSVFWNDYKDEKSAKENGQFSIRLDGNHIVLESMEDFASHSGNYNYENLEFINSHIDNSWIQYFIRKRMRGENWIDFEREIENVLVLIEEYYNKFLPEMRKKNDAVSKYIPDEMRAAVSAFKSKCPSEYDDLTQGILSQKRSQPEMLKRNKEMLIETMKQELNDLIRCLGYYLLEFVSIIKVSQYSKQIEELKYVNLLNFNYTYTYATVYGKTRLKQHHRVHGDCLEEDMVLGISDDAFPETLDYIFFQKYFQRIQKKTGNYFKEWIKMPDPQIKTLDNTLINVFIMGHSFAATDKGIMKEIFINDYVQTIKIFYHSQSSYEQQVINLVEMFERDFIIEQTAKGRVIFEKLEEPVKGIIR